MCEQPRLPAWARQIQMPRRSEGAFYSLFNSNFKNPSVPFFPQRDFSDIGLWLLIASERGVD